MQKLSVLPGQAGSAWMHLTRAGVLAQTAGSFHPVEMVVGARTLGGTRLRNYIPHCSLRTWQVPGSFYDGYPCRPRRAIPVDARVEYPAPLPQFCAPTLHSGRTQAVVAHIFAVAGVADNGTLLVLPVAAEVLPVEEDDQFDAVVFEYHNGFLAGLEAFRRQHGVAESLTMHGLFARYGTRILLPGGREIVVKGNGFACGFSAEQLGLPRRFRDTSRRLQTLAV